MKKPIIEISNLKKINFVNQKEEIFKRIFLKNLKFNDKINHEIVLDASLFNRVNFSDCNLSKSKISDCIFENCDFANMLAEKGNFYRSEIKNSRCIGLQISEGILEDVLFFQSVLDISSFRFAKLKNICFDECELNEADFIGTSMENIIFKSCKMKDSEFSQAKLKNVDFRGSDLTNIHIDKNNVDNLIVDTGQAIYLSSLFGLKIKD
jgi:uncharacterized protein YjbI with pentapeptide repeats